MEILLSDPNEELAVIEEDDEEFYEKIEAPKFVDFSVPDRSRSDDKSWFCLRIGCDQQHEEVDPDALNRSFMLRVMAARSPNIKLQKALYRQAPRSMKNCPRSAPAKSARDRVSRFSTATSIPDKMAKTKLKTHPVSSLRSTPTNSKKPKERPPASEKKATTTPRTKKCTSYHEPFQSVKHQKAAPVAATKDRSAARALFAGVPKKNGETSKIVNSEICVGMKKLDIGTRPRKGEGNSRVRLKKGNETKNNVEENNSVSSMLTVKDYQQPVMADSTSSNNSSEVSRKNIAVLKAAKEVENNSEFDENKENDSGTSNMDSSMENSDVGSLQIETSENIPQKEIKPHGKKIQEHNTQVRKLKRTTNPKPFRLRTDERGILKEANLEKKIHLEKAQKDGIVVLSRVDGKQQNASHAKNHQIVLDKGQDDLPNQIRTPRVRFVKSRYATTIPKFEKPENKEAEESQKKVMKPTTSSRQMLRPQSVTTTRKAQVSQLREKGELPMMPRVTANLSCAKRKTPSAIPKGAITHRILATTSCTRRPMKTSA